MRVRIYQANKADLGTAATLAAELWRSHSIDDMETELSDSVARGGVVFLAEEDGAAAGFSLCQLRRDYVEGTETSPVGYLEGVYVREGFRLRGVATSLIKACENWAAAQGCVEFASDCELDNADSLKFHLRAGFREANRVICFTKRLDGGNET